MRIRFLGYSALLIGIMSGCSDDITTGKIEPPETIFWRLNVQTQGVTMAVDQTQPILVTPLNILGDPMVVPDSLPVRFESTNPTKVTVDSNGIMTGREVTDYDVSTGPIPVFVTVSWTYGAVTKVDTVFVAVTDTAPTHPVTSLKILSTYPTDSTWGGFFFFNPKMFTAIANTSQGDSLSNVYAFFFTNQRRKQLPEVLDPVSRRLAGSVVPGTYWIYAESMIYGTLVRDSIKFTVTDPAVALIAIWPGNNNGVDYSQGGVGVTTFAPPCAWILFQNILSVTVRYVLDLPSEAIACDESDETREFEVPSNGLVIRKIRSPGTYTWTALKEDGHPFTPAVTGKIQVRDHTAFE